MTRSLLLRELFGSAVLTEEVRLFVDPLSELLPEEAVALKSARAERLMEFRAGRHCARLALSRLGLGATAILRAEDRSPVWPAGIVGSITHTRDKAHGWAGAVVARGTDLRSVGVDAELDEPLKRNLWRHVLTQNEQRWILERPQTEQGFLGKLVFSAKESIYKCQYLLSHQFLDFADVELGAPIGDTFVGTLLRDAAPFRSGHVFEGRHSRGEGYIVTGVTLPHA